MRISVLREDPDCLTFGDWRQYFAKVFLNGEEVKGCFSADEEAGTVVVLWRGADGRIRSDQYGNIQMETLHGAVRIDLPTGLDAVAAIASHARDEIMLATVRHSVPL